MGNSVIKIFVVCHKPAYVPKYDMLIPIQAGAALAQYHYEGMVYDDSGDHISNKNPLYCELTAQYWAWKNIDADYYGFFHYRRYLSFQNEYAVDVNGGLNVKRNPAPYMELDRIPEDLSEFGYNCEKAVHMIEKNELLTVMREKLNITVYSQYCQYHDKNDLDQVIKILKERHPQFSEAADQYLSSKYIYYMNIYIMKKSLFLEYAEWLFDILETFEAQMAVKEQERLFGYLAERLFGIFYVYQRNNGVKCAEFPYLMFYNTQLKDGQILKKQEKMYREFQLKPTNIKLKLDMRKLNRFFPAGSRRRLWLRSIFLR